MFICINNNEEKFLILDTIDGVCEWTHIKDCRKYLEMGVKIEGLFLKNLDKIHKYLDYVPSKDFIPHSIKSEVLKRNYYPNEILSIINDYILNGNNILDLRELAGSYENFIQELRRWCGNG